MTIGEAVAVIDSRMVGNQYSFEEKIRWLSDLDKRIYAEIMSRRADCEISGFVGYTPQTDLNEPLLADGGYGDMYIYYLEAMINKANCEYSRYNNSMIMFNTIYSLFARQYNRTHRVVSADIDY